MSHKLTITVDDTVYQTLKPMIEQNTFDIFLREFIKNHQKENYIPNISVLRGTLHNIDTSDIREETDRHL